ncbi:MAG: LysR family transcriptional regulator [Myxococcota bacterium]
MLADLPLFLSVAELGSFTQAADVQGLPRSTLSRRIRALEAGLGCRLFERTTRHVRLTPEGRRLAEDARPLVGSLQRLLEDVRDQGSTPTGRVRTGAPVGLGREFITQFIAELREELPGIAVEVVASEGPPNVIRDQLDIALAEGPLPETGAIAKLLLATEARCVASPDYLEQHGTPRTTEDLRDHATLHRPRGPGPARWSLRAGGSIDVAPLLATTDVGALIDVTRGGLGIALLSDALTQEARDAGELVQLLPEIAEPRTYYAVFAYNDPPRRVRAVLDFATRFVARLVLASSGP